MCVCVCVCVRACRYGYARVLRNESNVGSGLGRYGPSIQRDTRDDTRERQRHVPVSFDLFPFSLSLSLFVSFTLYAVTLVFFQSIVVLRLGLVLPDDRKVR